MVWKYNMDYVKYLFYIYIGYRREKSFLFEESYREIVLLRELGFS